MLNIWWMCYKFGIMTLMGPITSWQIDGEKVEMVTDFIFLGSKFTADSDCSHEIKTLAPWKKSHDKPRQHIKKQRHYFADKSPYSQSYGFSSSHVWIWELDHKEDWVQKNWCFLTVVLEKTLESSLDSKEIKPVSPKGNQSWIFIGRTDAEVPILWPPDVKSQLTGKDPDAGKDWRQEEKGTTENEMAGWHHWLNGHESEQIPGGREGKEVRLGREGKEVRTGKSGCSPWGHSQTQLSEWTTTKHVSFLGHVFIGKAMCAQ